LTTYHDGNCTATRAVETVQISTQCAANAAAYSPAPAPATGQQAYYAGDDVTGGVGVNALAYQWALVTTGPAPTAAPALAPAPAARPHRPGGPSRRPTTAPSPPPRRNVTVRVTQTLGRINVTEATHAAFVHVFQAAVAAVLSVPWQVRHLTTIPSFPSLFSPLITYMA
jgi:hypothetical protein